MRCSRTQQPTSSAAAPTTSGAVWRAIGTFAVRHAVGSLVAEPAVQARRFCLPQDQRACSRHPLGWGHSTVMVRAMRPPATTGHRDLRRADVSAGCAQRFTRSWFRCRCCSGSTAGSATGGAAIAGTGAKGPSALASCVPVGFALGMQSPPRALPTSSNEGLKAAVVDALGLLEATSLRAFRGAVVRALAQAAWDEMAAAPEPRGPGASADAKGAARGAGARLNAACERVLGRVRQLAPRANPTPWDGAAEALRHVRSAEPNPPPPVVLDAPSIELATSQRRTRAGRRSQTARCPPDTCQRSLGPPTLARRPPS